MCSSFYYVSVQLAGFQLTSDQIDQVLGVGMSIAGLVNRSSTIVPMIVRSYDSSFQQTISSVQSEMRSQQQIIIYDFNALNQLLTNYNDSTIIGDTFVRYQ